MSSRTTCATAGAATAAPPVTKVRTSFGLFGAVGFGAAARAGSAVSAVLVVVFIARHVSIAEMAIVFLALQGVRFLSVACMFGLQNYTQKQAGIAAGAGDAAGYYGTLRAAALAFLVANGVALVLFLLAWPFINSTLLKNAIPAYAGVLLFLVGMLRSGELVVSAGYRARGDLLVGLSLLGLPRDIIVIACLWALVFIGEPLSLTSILMALIAGSCVVMAVPLFRLMRPRGLTLGQITRAPLAGVWSNAWPMYTHALASVVYTTSDLWFVSAFGATEEVSYYGAAVRLVAILVFLLGVVNLIIPSLIASYWARGDRTSVESVARASSTIVCFLAVPAAAVLWFGGGRILGLAFGPGYEAGHLFLLILTAGSMVSAIVGSPGVILQMTGHHRLLVRLTLTTCLLALPAFYLGAKLFGALGVAVVASGSLALQNLLMAAVTWHRLRVRTYPYFSVYSLRESLTRVHG